MGNLEYKNRVFSWLQSQTIGKTEIDKVSKPETRQQFLATIKEAIDLRFLWHEGYYFEFNEDYTILAKKKL